MSIWDYFHSGIALKYHIRYSKRAKRLEKGVKSMGINKIGEKWGEKKGKN